VCFDILSYVGQAGRDRRRRSRRRGRAGSAHEAAGRSIGSASPVRNDELGWPCGFQVACDDRCGKHRSQHGRRGDQHEPADEDSHDLEPLGMLRTVGKGEQK
jgi:hypothetical protein